MYISPSAGAVDGYLSGGGAVIHSNGYSLSDSARALPPGTKGPGFTETVGGGSIGAYYDASWLLPYGQGLLFKGFFNYSGADLTLGSFAGGGGSAGSARFNTYTFGGKFLYELGSAAYVEGTGSGSFGNGSETISVDSSSGSFNTQGYTTDLRVGTIVPLFTTGGAAPSIVNKAPTRQVIGSVVAVDLSGHVGYASGQINGFTDSTGFAFGTIGRNSVMPARRSNCSRSFRPTAGTGCRMSPELSISFSAIQAR
jgi:hypothetical protein